MLTQRLDPKDIIKTDQLLKHFVKCSVVLAVCINVDRIQNRTNVSDAVLCSLHVKAASLRLVEEACSKFGGWEISDAIFGFKDVLQAALAALYLQELVKNSLAKAMEQKVAEQKQNFLKKTGKEMIKNNGTSQIKPHSFSSPRSKSRSPSPVRASTFQKPWILYSEVAKSMVGIAIECGTILVVPRTDICWGEAVRKATAMANEAAEGGQLVISGKVYDTLYCLPRAVERMMFLKKKMAKHPHQRKMMSAIGVTSLFTVAGKGDTLLESKLSEETKIITKETGKQKQKQKKYSRKKNISNQDNSNEEVLDNKWAKLFFKKPVAVLATKLQSISKLCKNHGSIHMVSIILRFRQLVLPHIYKCEPLFVKTEVDKLFVVFDTTAAAVKAGAYLYAVINEFFFTIHNSRIGSAPSKKKFAVPLAAVAIAWGKGVVVDVEDKIHGWPFHMAQAMVENVGLQCDLVLSVDAYEKIESISDFSMARFYTQKKSNIVRLDPESLIDNIENLVITPLNDFTQVSRKANLFLKRMDIKPSMSSMEQGNLTKMQDRLLRRKYLKPCAFVVIHLELHCGNAVDTLGAKFALLPKLKQIFVAHGASTVEDVLYMFDEVSSAIVAAVEVWRFVHSLDSEMNVLRGIAVGGGDLCLVYGTDIHYGDCLNTAFHLAQVEAINGELLLSNEAFQLIPLPMPDFHGRPYGDDLLPVTRLMNKCFNGIEVIKDHTKRNGVTYVYYELRESGKGKHIQKVFQRSMKVPKYLSGYLSSSEKQFDKSEEIINTKCIKKQAKLGLSGFKTEDSRLGTSYLRQFDPFIHYLHKSNPPIENMHGHRQDSIQSLDQRIRPKPLYLPSSHHEIMRDAVAHSDKYGRTAGHAYSISPRKGLSRKIDMESRRKKLKPIGSIPKIHKSETLESNSNFVSIGDQLNSSEESDEQSMFEKLDALDPTAGVLMRKLIGANCNPYAKPICKEKCWFNHDRGLWMKIE